MGETCLEVIGTVRIIDSTDGMLTIVVMGIVSGRIIGRWGSLVMVVGRRGRQLETTNGTARRTQVRMTLGEGFGHNVVNKTIALGQSVSGQLAADTDGTGLLIGRNGVDEEINIFVRKK